MIDTDNPKKYKIKSVDSITHDTSAFKFELAEGESLDFLPGDHMMMSAEIEGGKHQRPYTPSSTPDDNGYFEIIIKRYENGLMSSYVHEKSVGDEVILQGPTKGGHFNQGMAKRIGMVAGGAGVTPFISIVRTAIRRNWEVDMTLLFANKSAEDIILKDEFDKYAAEHDNFKIVHTIDEEEEGWNGHVGHIDQDMLKANLPEPGSDTLIFLCGPPMMEFQLRKAVLALGYDKKQLVIP